MTRAALALSTIEPIDAPADAGLMARIDAACRRIAPLWPLKHFVAVNPFLGFTGQSFAATAATFDRVVRTRMLMPRAFYRGAIEDGRIDDAALAQALGVHPSMGLDVDQLKLKAHAEPGPSSPPAVVATVAEVLDRLAKGDRDVSLVTFMIDEISAFCASYFDEGQASWPNPARKLRPYAAWRKLAAHDRNPEVMGLTGFRKAIAELPADPVQAIGLIIDRLGIPERAVEDYLVRALFDIGGWSAYARYIGWGAELDGGRDDTLLELLAIRLAWGFALFQARTDEAFTAAWAQAMAEAARLPADHRLDETPELAIDLILHEAYEIAFRRKLIAQLAQHGWRTAVAPTPARPPVQAAFCIDVRSEIFRRALETAYPDAETIGFAGFFGFPIEYVPIGHTKGGAQCPVLLKPAFIVCEAVRDADGVEEAEVLGLRLLRRRAAKAWKSFKVSAVSSFSFVETAGLGFAAKIATDSAGVTRPVPSPVVDGLDPEIAARVQPRLTPGELGGRVTGFDDAQRVAMAEAVLKAMSLTGPFARLVVLAGHGSTTVNNPHASGLDCGACGGHTGEANARVAAAVLNDWRVREGLRAKGIDIPADCWFIGALHDTTTDAVTLFDESDVPAGLAPDLARLKVKLADAARLARLERSVLLGIRDTPDVDDAVIARSRDWSQVRPEWGLAGNAAFIAAPRSFTRGLDLGGRAFLHSYEAARDDGFRTLELIMTAPMVVASWINLQYFGSSVNNAAFGSGNKVLHNVVGQLGVLEGNAGDLRTGLPWQSVHDGTSFIHEPIRLNVVIAAPESAMDTIMQRHQGVRDLVSNGWVMLYSLDERGTVRRCLRPGVWTDAGADGW
ncbi:YbcC family protein [Bradyrhizobium sp. HKCCYLS20291]|uniref:YbcC family protein n=1 Tax=Bradyrhizobium sp. HKCCYLS20291 TaxID=3420766 RepID=UPI003EBF365F